LQGAGTAHGHRFELVVSGRQQVADAGESFGDLPELGGEGFVVGLLLGADFDRVTAHLAEAVGTIETARLRIGRAGGVESGKRALRVGLGDESDEGRNNFREETAAGAWSRSEEVGVGDSWVDDEARCWLLSAGEAAVQFESKQ
jgi:hypothetical protein